MLPFLTDEEMDEICRPLTQGAAQIRYMQRLGLIVKRRPDGTPLVGRAHYEAVMGGPKTGPKVDPGQGPKWTVKAELPQHLIHNPVKKRR